MRKLVEEITTVKRECICCDKCGRNIDSDWETIFPNGKKYFRTKVIHEEHCHTPWYADEMGIYRTRGEYPPNMEKQYDLCEKCYNEFLKWIGKGEK